MRVHSELGCGLLESAYLRSLSVELTTTGIQHRCEVPMTATYRGQEIGLGLRADLVVEQRVIVEIKAVRAVEAVHKRQLLSYLHASGLEVGLLLNFGAESMRHGITRLVSTRPKP